MVQEDVLLLVGIIAHDDGASGFRGAEIDGLVWHPRWDEEKLPGFSDG